VNFKKKKVRKNVAEEIGLTEDLGTLLKEVEALYDKYGNADYSFESLSWEGSDYYGGIIIHTLREETDEEFSKRVEACRTGEQKLKDKELKELERLKEKYESN